MKRSKARAAMDEVVESVGDVVAIPIDFGADLIDEIAPDVIDVAEAAASTVAATGRVGLRLAARTIRFVARHPKEVLAGVVVVAAVVAVLKYLSSQSSSDSAG